MLVQTIWHGAKTLVVPDTIKLVPYPVYVPELNPNGAGLAVKRLERGRRNNGSCLASARSRCLLSCSRRLNPEQAKRAAGDRLRPR